jgi:hypothetical protein
MGVNDYGSAIEGVSAGLFLFFPKFIDCYQILHHHPVILGSGSRSQPGDNRMRKQWITLLILPCAPLALQVQGQAPEPPGQLVREVVYNEFHDHQRHGYWRYWIERPAQQPTRLEEQVETADGPLTRLVANSGRPLSAADQESEQERLERLVHSPQEQARRRQDYNDDEKRIGRILALLPDAFSFSEEGLDNGCTHLRFWPNPSYPPRSIEARIFHAMHGEIWIDMPTKRLKRLEGQLEENVDFGFGIIGRLYKGGWFRLERIQVSATDWKTERLEIHMNGRAFFLKTIGRQTSEVRGGFAPVPPGLSLANAMKLFLPLQATALTGASFPMTP